VSDTLTLQVTGQNSAVYLFGANEGPYLIVNGDSQNPVYLGDSSAVNVSDPAECIPLLPGASIGYTADHDQDVFINGTPGVVSPVYVIPGASGYFRPVSDLILQGLNPGIFIYRPYVGYNNLVGAWAALAGVDQWGNAYGAGITLNQGTIQGISLSSGALLNSYLQATNIANAAIGGPSVSGGNILGSTIVQTEQGGVLLGYGAGLEEVTLTQTQQWPVPSGVTFAKVECFAGSGGGGANASVSGAGAGGGPEYSCEPNYPLVSGTSVAAIVGAGGIGANGTGTGGNGGITSFDNTVIAHPGQGGGPLNGGAPGQGSINTIHYPGGQGGDGSSLGGGGGGGGGASALGAGLPGASATSSTGGEGGSPGGGTGGDSDNPGATGTSGGGGGAGSGSPGTNFIFYCAGTYSYYGADATTNPANSLRNTNSILYSGEDVLGTVNGNQYSFAYYGSLEAQLAGYTIVSCQLVVVVDYVVNGALSGILVVGTAPFTTFPATGMSLSGATQNITQASVTGEETWIIDISQTPIPGAFQAGTATCILFGPGPSTVDTYFCEVTGGAGQNNNGPYLIFNVVEA
jgi:hypothetical protein